MNGFRRLDDALHHGGAGTHDLLVECASTVLVLAPCGHFLEIVPGAIARPIGGKDNRVNFSIFRDQPDLVRQRRNHLHGKCVASRRPVQRQNGDGSVAACQYGRIVTLSTCSRTGYTFLHHHHPGAASPLRPNNGFRCGPSYIIQYLNSCISSPARIHNRLHLRTCGLVPRHHWHSTTASHKLAQVPYRLKRRRTPSRPHPAAVR